MQRVRGDLIRDPGDLEPDVTKRSTPDSSEPDGRSHKHRQSRRDMVTKVLVGVVLLGLWQVVVEVFAADFVARPSRVIPQIPTVLSDASFWRAAEATLGAFALGMVIALIAGTVLGLMIGLIRPADHATRLYVSGLYAMPIIAIVPLVTLWFGYSSQSRLIIIVFAAIVPIVYNVAEGARSIPREYIDVSQAYRAKWWTVWFGIALPSSLPYVLAAVNLAAGRALVGAIVAEYLTAVEGLGFYILAKSRSFEQDAAMVAVLVLALTGTLLFVLTRVVERRAFPWYRRG